MLCQRIGHQHFHLRRCPPISTLAEELRGFEGKSKTPRVEVAFEAGKLLAEKAKTAGVETVVFDRGGYKYHGRVKAFAEGARKGGLEF